MTKKLTFTVTRDPSVATADISSKSDVQVVFDRYWNDGRIIDADVVSTSDPNITNDEITFKDSASYQSYINEIKAINSDTPLNAGYTISNFAVS